MEPREALIAFLTSTLTKSKRDRYVGFASKHKTETKFLSAIYHDLENCFDQTKRVTSFKQPVLELPGYRFAPSNVFGEPMASIGEVCNGWDESFLVVSVDGRYGIHGPETVIDSRAFYIASSK